MDSQPGDRRIGFEVVRPLSQSQSLDNGEIAVDIVAQFRNKCNWQSMCTLVEKITSHVINSEFGFHFTP